MLDDFFGFGKAIVKDFLYDVVCYSAGWILLRIVTFTKYPEEALVEGIQDEDSDLITGLVGLGVLAFLAVSLGWKVL